MFDTTHGFSEEYRAAVTQIIEQARRIFVEMSGQASYGDEQNPLRVAALQAAHQTWAQLQARRKPSYEVALAVVQEEMARRMTEEYNRQAGGSS